MKRFLLRALRRMLNDKNYIKVRYFIKFKRFINLNNPQTFNEKINWLKLYDRNSLYSTIVDKYEVRKFVADHVGDHVLNKVYGVYDSVEDIDLNILPDKFVAKATHGSGWVILCKDKNNFNWYDAKSQMAMWLRNNFYELWGEWPYKNVKPRIIIEEYLQEEGQTVVRDYKFYCFNGQAKFLHVDEGRGSNLKRTFFSLEWERLPFTKGYPASNGEIPEPKCMNEMIELSNTLSQDFSFIRVDFFVVHERPIFGELTLYPMNGMSKFKPDPYEYEIGKLIRLND